jgi:hypothetical protein
VYKQGRFGEGVYGEVTDLTNFSLGKDVDYPDRVVLDFPQIGE